MPIFVARQWVRHRTASLNELSGRYSELPSEYYVPDYGRLQKQSSTNKQGSAPEGVFNPDGTRQVIQDRQHDSFNTYNWLLNTAELSRELARIVTPLGTYTEWYWKMDLHNLFHFLALRLDPHAQWEIQEYAKVIFEITTKVAPMATDAFRRNVLEAVTLSREDADRLQSYVCSGVGLGGDSPRKDAEFRAKMETLGLDGWRV
jgi:thymidylate synthase (FAD)